MGDLQIHDTDKIIDIPKSSYTPNKLGLGYELFLSMEKYKNKIAQIDGITGELDSYESLMQRCVRTALKMRSLGITTNDIVSTCTFNHLDSCVPFFATLFLGAKMTNFDPTSSVKNTTYLINLVTPKIIFVDSESLDLVEEAIKQIDKDIMIVLFGPSNKHVSFSSFLQFHTEESTFKPKEVTNLKSTALIAFTSGTTDIPKAVCISHYAFIVQQINLNKLHFCTILIISFGFSNMGFCYDITLNYLSLFPISSSTMPCQIIFLGCIRLVVPKFNTHLIWKSIEIFKPTLVFGNPFVFIHLYNTKPKNANTSSIKQIAISGSILKKKQIVKIQSAFPTTSLIGLYGQTELCGTITVRNPKETNFQKFLVEKRTSCGTGVPGVSYKIVSIDSEEILGPNQIGELRLKTDCCLTGYYNMDDSDCWDENGWYRTYDLVYYDEDKHFFVVDRLKEFITFKCWNIAPSILESVIVSHPNVNNALVIGIPHETDVNHLMALVELTDPNIKTYPQEIETFFEDRVDDKNRLRGGVKIVEKIPVPEVGKIQRKKIIDMYLKGQI